MSYNQAYWLTSTIDTNACIFIRLYWKYCMYFHCTSWLGAQLWGMGEAYTRGCGKQPLSTLHLKLYMASTVVTMGTKVKQKAWISLGIGTWWHTKPLMMCQAPWDECITVCNKFAMYGRERADGHLMQPFIRIVYICMCGIEGITYSCIHGQ